MSDLPDFPRVRLFEEPSAFVDSFHNLPHYNYDMRRYNGIFEPPLDENGDLVDSIEDYEYGQTLVVALAFMLVIGFVIFAGTIAWACCRQCCCRRKSTDEFGNDVGQKATKVAKIGTIFFGLLAIAASLYGFSTASDFTSATNALTDADSAVRGLQSRSITVADTISGEIDTSIQTVDILIEELAGTPVEDNLTALRLTLVDTNTFVDDFQGQVTDVELSEDIPEALDSASDVYLGLTIFIFVVAIIVAVMAMLNVFLSTDKPCLKLTVSWLGAILMFIIWIAFTIEFVLAILISDICIDSDAVVLDVAARVNDLPDIGEDTIVFYVSCQDEPALSHPLNDTLTTIDGQLNLAIVGTAQIAAQLPGNGTGEQEVAAINASLQTTLGASQEIGDIISCDSVNPIYQTIKVAACNDVILALGNACVALGLAVGAVFAARLFICKEKPDSSEQWRANNLAGGEDYTSLDVSNSTSRTPAASGVDYAGAGDDRRIEIATASN